MKKAKETINEEFYRVIAKQAEQDESLNTKEIYELFPDANKKTISWRLYELVQQGLLIREEHGHYSLGKNENNVALGYNYLQLLSKEIYDFMQEYGYKFYITGLDALGGEILHVPESFPVLMVVEEKWLNEIQAELAAKDYLVMTAKDINEITNSSLKNMANIILLAGKDFTMATDNIANKEKGFIDLYYAVTRLNYPLAIPEVSRIYLSMKRNKTVTSLKLSRAAKDSGIRSEIDWLLALKNATAKTKEFMEYQLKEEI